MQTTDYQLAKGAANAAIEIAHTRTDRRQLSDPTDRSDTFVTSRCNSGLLKFAAHSP